MPQAEQEAYVVPTVGHDCCKRSKNVLFIPPKRVELSYHTIAE